MKIVTDDKVLRILDSISDSAKSAKEISDSCNLPISTVYRKIRILREKEFLSVSGTINDGVRNYLFRKKLHVEEYA